MSGSSLLLDVGPATRPAMVGAYDFQLLDAVRGRTCISRSNRTSVYWVGLQNLAEMNSDRLTQQAIAAAAFDAISRLHRADTLVITRVVAEGQGSERVCAIVHGRGVRLIKEPEVTEPKPATAPKSDETAFSKSRANVSGGSEADGSTTKRGGQPHSRLPIVGRWRNANRGRLQRGQSRTQSLFGRQQARRSGQFSSTSPALMNC